MNDMFTFALYLFFPSMIFPFAFLCCTRNMVMRELAPQFHIPWSIPMEAEDIPIVPTTSGTMYVLKNKIWKIDQRTTVHMTHDMI